MFRNKYNTILIKLLNPNYLLIVILFFGLISACSNEQDNINEHLQKGKNYYDAKNYNKARIEYQNILQKDNKHAEARYHLAQTYKKLKNPTESFQHYQKLLRQHPEHVNAKLSLAELYLDYGYPDKSEPLINSVLEKNTEKSRAYYLRSRLNIIKGAHNDAFSDAKKAVSTSKYTSSDSIILLSKLYLHNKDTKNALQTLNETMTLLPDNIDLKLATSEVYLALNRADNFRVLVETIDSSKITEARQIIKLAELYIANRQLQTAENILVEAAGGSDLTLKLAHVNFIAKYNSTVRAINILKEYVKEDQKSSNLKFALASLYQNTGQYTKSTDTLNIIVNEKYTEKDKLTARKLIVKNLIHDNELDIAKQHLKIILDNNASDIEARLMRANLSMLLEEYQSAYSDINNILKREPGNKKALNLKVQLNLKKGLIDDARDILASIVKKDPNDVKTLIRLTNILDSMDKGDQAIEVLRTYLARDPRNANVLNSLILLQVKYNKINEARLSARDFSMQFTETQQAYYLNALVEKSDKNYKQAIDSLEAGLKKHPFSKQLLKLLAVIHINTGKKDALIKTLEMYRKKYSTFLPAQYLLAEILLLDNQLSYVKRIYKNILITHPDQIEACLRLADLYLLEKNTAQALEILNKGLQNDSNNEVLRLKLAMIYTINNQTDNAISQYEKLFALNPNNKITANNYAMLLINNKTDQDSIIKANKVINVLRYDKNPVFQDTRGWVAYKSGKYDEAITLLSEIVEQQPDNMEFNYHLGMAFAKKGYAKLAKRYLTIATSKKSNSPWYRQASEELKTLSNN